MESDYTQMTIATYNPAKMGYWISAKLINFEV
jgi:hypothetical protein